MIILAGNEQVGVSNLVIYDICWFDNSKIKINKKENNGLITSISLNIKELTEEDLNNGYIKAYMLFNQKTTWKYEDEIWHNKNINFDKDKVKELLKEIK